MFARDGQHFTINILLVLLVQLTEIIEGVSCVDPAYKQSYFACRGCEGIGVAMVKP